MRGATAAVGVLCAVGLIAAAVRPEPSVQAPTLEATLRGHVEARIGAAPIDCGQLRLTRDGDRWLPPGEDALRRALQCGNSAAARRAPFWTFVQHQGIDSEIARGLLAASDGVIQRFRYDSAPCGGPGCDDSFTVERCDTPGVAKGPAGWAFACAAGEP